jgi:ribosome-associated protein
MQGSIDKIRIPDHEFEFSFSRSSGPGGQNVNKVNSKALLRWNPATTHALNAAQKSRFFARYGNSLTDTGDILIKSDRFRDQRQNRDDCIDKLVAMLQKIITPPKKRVATKPTFSSRQEKRSNKQKLGTKKLNRKKVRTDD